jgi:radical SAM protein with 4Fe4S-binding SPASM domain
LKLTPTQKRLSVPAWLSGIASERGIPLAVLVELTRKCNLECGHCYLVRSPGRRELDTPRLFSLFGELRRAGCLFLALSGGEPLLRRDFPAILRKAGSMGFALQVLTNGQLVDERMASVLAEANVFSVSLSMYDCRAAGHDCVTGTPGSFDKTISAIRLMREINLPVVMKFVITSRNFMNFDAMRSLARSFRAVARFDTVITPKDDGCPSPLRFRTGDAMLGRVFAKMRADIRYSGRAKRSPESLLCTAGRSFCSVNAYGDVYPCVQWPVRAGNVRTRDFLGIWKSSPVLERIRSTRPEDLKACVECGLLNYCRRCPGLAHVEDGSSLSASSEACRQARAMRRAVARARHSRPA